MPYEGNCVQNVNLIFMIDSYLNPKHEILNSKQSQMTKLQILKKNKSLRHLDFEFVSDFDIRISDF